MNKKNLLNLAYILLVSIALALAYNYFSPAGIPVSGEIVVPEENVASQVNEVSSEEALKLLEEGNVIFIDARDRWEYGDAHIKGALNMPEYKTENEDLVESTLSKTGNYIIYCGSSDCGTSKKLAEKMSEVGFTRISVLGDGWQDWVDKGYPVEDNDE